MDRHTLYNYLNKLVDNNVVGGMTLAVITKESRELFFVGKSDEENYVSVDSIYDLASVSKVIGTLSGILKLIEEGLITLDTKVSDILLDYKHDSTMLDLLIHSSGLPADDKDYRNTKTRDEFKNFVYNLELEYLPNTKVVYSDFGFNLLGFIIEHFKGDIDDYLNEVLFLPLKMYNTTYKPQNLNQDLIVPTENHITRGLIKGEVMDGKAFVLDGLSGNAGLFSNINDLANYAQMILNRGKLFNKEIFKQSTIDLLLNNYTKNLDINRTIGYALNDDFFAQGKLSSDQIIYHTGFSGPMILIDFKHDFSIIHLTNRTYPNRDNTKILDERNTLIDNIYTYLLK